MDLGNKDISLLAGHLLWLSWRGHIRIICTVAEESERDKAQEYLQRLLGLARLPHMDMLILAGPFQQTLKTAPSADLNIFGLPETISLDFVRKTLDQVGTTCLFTRDSGYENVLA